MDNREINDVRVMILLVGILISLCLIGLMGLKLSLNDKIDNVQQQIERKCK
jgi:hypothetical protein